jgi:hypothetical protein
MLGAFSGVWAAPIQQAARQAQPCVKSMNFAHWHVPQHIVLRTRWRGDIPGVIWVDAKPEPVGSLSARLGRDHKLTPGFGGVPL